jgi:hypothetical protein
MAASVGLSVPSVADLRPWRAKTNWQQVDWGSYSPWRSFCFRTGSSISARVSTHIEARSTQASIQNTGMVITRFVSGHGFSRETVFSVVGALAPKTAAAKTLSDG